MGRRFIRKFKSWNLDKKIFTFVTSLNCCISVIMLAVFTFFYFSSYISQSSNITENQLSALATNYEYTLNSFRDLSEALIIDNTIQDYLRSDMEEDGYFDRTNNARNTMQNAVNMYPNVNYIIIGENVEQSLYKGNTTQIGSKYKSVYKEDYASSVPCCDQGPLRMSYSDAYLGGGNKTLNLYIPVYSTSIIHKQIGLLCMIFTNGFFNGLSDTNAIHLNSQVMMMDKTSRIVSSTNDNLVGTKFQDRDMLRGRTGGFVIKNNLYNYRKINNWAFYLVDEIPLMDMYRNGIIVILLLAVIFIVLTYLGLTFCNKIIYRSYKPLDHVVQAMNHVAQGQLDVRINLKNVGSDFDKLADGFNYMMDEMKTLMEQVKREQQQMDQIRFNALQSQIQPHFLYNALDSIHWQAMADGNKELSAFVKALAQYYRLCLSNGKDVICLEQEIEHVKNYLIIQNMRYDDIIDVQIEIGEDCKYTLIPKITLQPLVENSIYHGIKVKDGKGGQIKITVYREKDDVYVLVADNGTGMTTDQINQFNHSLSDFGKDSGYGIRNVNRRLQLLFGKEYGLHYDKNESCGVTVQVHLPGHEIMQCEEVL